MPLLLVFVVLLALRASESSSFEGYKVYHVTPDTLEKARILDSYHYDKGFDFWEESNGLGDPSDIMVAPEDQLAFEGNLSKYQFDYNVVIDNVERLLQQERIERTLTRTFLAPGQITFASFLSYSEHMSYLRRLGNDYPNIATVVKIGESYEGRDILMLKVSSGPSSTSTPKPGIFIDAGIHCREWIAPPVALYIIQQLVENTGNAALYENVDWYIVPNLNPDGYEYTQSNNRLWRKNRRLTEGQECYGTDLNRNFGYFWMHAGASQDSCTEIYAGAEAFSEPESQAIRDWVLDNGENVKLYLSFHSYGEMMLYPWGYAPILPDNHEELHYVGQLAATAIDDASTINSRYRVNSSAILLYEAAGGSDDWVKAEGGVDLSYCVELPDGDAPFFFMIPARQILPAVRETFEGVKAFHAYIEEKFWTDRDQDDDEGKFILH